MYETDRLIYIQMQKTGCTHIASLLERLYDGQAVGKHNPATPAQLRSGKFFLSSIRNPWDWYVSLWAYGVQGEGALMRRLARRDPVQAIADIAKRPSVAFKMPARALTKNARLWRSVYDRADNVESFRRWLKFIHEPGNRPYLGEECGHRDMASLVGFMTSRYLQLCCRNVAKLNKRGYISLNADLVQFDRDYCYIDHFVRQEALEEGLCRGLERIAPLAEEERELIFGSKRSNTSRRSLPVAAYYDPETIELVRERDRLIVEKFGYSPPTRVQ